MQTSEATKVVVSALTFATAVAFLTLVMFYAT
jgi:hypothetical protein